MTYAEMLAHVRAQLALDLNCSPSDFEGEGFVFCELKNNPGRRPFPREARHFEMLTMGGAVVVAATADILPFIREELAGKTRDEAFSMPFVYGQGLYFLPQALPPPVLPAPASVRLEVLEPPAISERLYGLAGFEYALQNDVAHPRPDALAVAALAGGRVVGVAGASADCAMLWQIGIDVLPGHRGGGLAAALVSRLAAEVSARGKVPYYGTSSANIASQRVAFRCGFAPAWVVSYRGRFEGRLTGASG